MFKELESYQEVAPFADVAVGSFSLKLLGFDSMNFSPLIREEPLTK